MSPLALREPVPIRPEWPRYAPQVPFPRYRYVRGLNPHPVSDPRGNSHGVRPEPKAWHPSDWRHNEFYLFGVDLYNFAYWWEAHEYWEELWHLTDKNGPLGQFLQGLIQVSACAIKWHEHAPDGVRRLSEEGSGRLETSRAAADSEGWLMGIHLPGHLKAIREFYRPFVEGQYTETSWQKTDGFPLIRLEATERPA